MTNASLIQKLLYIIYYTDHVLSYLAAYDALGFIAQPGRYLKLLMSGIFFRFDLLVASLLVSHSEPSGCLGGCPLLQQGNPRKNEKA